MNRINKEKIHISTIILIIITCANIIFIWVHSMMNASTSAGESSFMLSFLESILKSFNIDAALTDNIIRKSAHFCEFASLGCLTLWSIYSINKNIARSLLPMGFICLFTAVIDEYIQLFSQGRSGEVKDIILDFTGSIFGAVFFILILIIILLIKKGKKK